MMNDVPKLTVYTDGSCWPNPGPGGWAAILQFENGTKTEIFGYELDTTNNRMEMKGFFETLDLLDDSTEIDLYSDSKYLCKGISQWMENWKRNGWKTSSGSEVKNKDLWMYFYEHLVIHKVRCHWIKGHSDNKWNEKADQIATRMCELAKKEAAEDF